MHLLHAKISDSTWSLVLAILFVRYSKCDWLVFPSFKVLIQESGERRFLAIGVVTENSRVHTLPGWHEGSVGYHIDDGNIFDPDNRHSGLDVKGLNPSVHTTKLAIHCYAKSAFPYHLTEGKITAFFFEIRAIHYRFIYEP